MEARHRTHRCRNSMPGRDWMATPLAWHMVRQGRAQVVNGRLHSRAHVRQTNGATTGHHQRCHEDSQLSVPQPWRQWLAAGGRLKTGHLAHRTAKEKGPPPGSQPCGVTRSWRDVVMQKANPKRLHLQTTRAKRHSLQSMRNTGRLRGAPHIFLSANTGGASCILP